MTELMTRDGSCTRHVSLTLNFSRKSPRRAPTVCSAHVRSVCARTTVSRGKLLTVLHPIRKVHLMVHSFICLGLTYFTTPKRSHETVSSCFILQSTNLEENMESEST